MFLGYLPLPSLCFLFSLYYFSDFLRPATILADERKYAVGFAVLPITRSPDHPITRFLFDTIHQLYLDFRVMFAGAKNGCCCCCCCCGNVAVSGEFRRS